MRQSQYLKKTFFLRSQLHLNLIMQMRIKWKHWRFFLQLNIFFSTRPFEWNKTHGKTCHVNVTLSIQPNISFFSSFSDDRNSSFFLLLFGVCQSIDTNILKILSFSVIFPTEKPFLDYTHAYFIRHTVFLFLFSDLIQNERCMVYIIRFFCLLRWHFAFTRWYNEEKDQHCVKYFNVHCTECSDVYEHRTPYPL